MLGEYVSALSNAAAFHYKAQAYFVWGVNDETHEVVGTTFNQHGDYNKEPYQNFLARNLSPSVNFSFEEAVIDDKRVVVLVILLRQKRFRQLLRKGGRCRAYFSKDSEIYCGLF